MDFPDATRFTARHDVVLVGYRGVDGSSRLDCPEVISSTGALARPPQRAVVRVRSPRRSAPAPTGSAATASISPATRCPSASTTSSSPAARSATDQIDLVSESAGTRTAMIYAWRYPKSIHRSVMIGVNPPGNFVWDAKTTGEQIRRYAALCAQATQAAGAGRPTSPRRCTPRSATIPSHWLVPADQEGQRPARRVLRPDQRDHRRRRPARRAADDRHAPLARQGRRAAARGSSPSRRSSTFPRAQVWGDVASIGRSDAAYAKRFFASGADHGSVIGSPGTDLVWAGGRLLDAWPANPDENEYTTSETRTFATLLIGGELDFATPPQNATRELLPHLANGRQVVLPKLGHADDFWAYEPAAVHPTDRHLPRHRPRRHVPLHRSTSSTSRRRSRRAESPRSSSASSSASRR